MELELKSNGMTINEYKKLIRMIRMESESEYGVKLDIEGLSSGQYSCDVLRRFKDKAIYTYNNPFLKKREAFTNVIGRLSAVNYDLKSSGLSGSKKAYISLKKIKNNNYDLLNKLFIVYHEMKHLLQEYSSIHKYYVSNIYDSFCDYMCREYASKNMADYHNYHDRFFHEIDANMFGIEKAEMFLKRFPKLYHENRWAIETWKNKYNFYLNNFNFDLFFSKILNSDGLTRYKPKTGLYAGRFIESTYRDIIVNYMVPDIKLSNSRSKNRLLNLILSNSEYLKYINFERLKERDKAQIAYALSFKRNDIMDKINFNNNFLNQKYIPSDSFQMVRDENDSLFYQLEEIEKLRKKLSKEIPYFNGIPLVRTDDIRDYYSNDDSTFRR